MKSRALTPDAAWRLVLDSLAVLPAEECPLAEALGRVLARPVSADRDLPAADRSAMDGFAVRSADTAKAPVTLRVCGEVAAGSPASPVLEPGECVRIFTGGNVPATADTVVRVEDTQPADGRDRVTFREPALPGRDILRRGENARRGDVLVPVGTRLAAAQIGLCAAVGVARVPVHRAPRVAVVTTGEELRSVADPVEPHQIRDSNGPMLCAGLAAEGFVLVRTDRTPDEAGAIDRSLRAALAAGDVVLVTGGVSVGDYDLVPAAVVAAGGRIRYHGVAMQPGRPQLFATFGDGRCLFGLPGNPLSVMNGFQEFVLPALRRMSGIPEADCRPALGVRLTADVRGKPGLQRLVLVRLDWGPNGPEATPIDGRGSADLVAGGKADGVLTVPPEVALIKAGEWGLFRPWRTLP